MPVSYVRYRTYPRGSAVHYCQLPDGQAIRHVELVLTHDLHTITAQTTRRGSGYGWRYRIGTENWVYQHADRLLPTEYLALDMALRTAKFLIGQRGKASEASFERERPEPSREDDHCVWPAPDRRTDD